MTDQPLTPARLAQLQAHFEHAVELPPDERERALSALSHEDADLAARVRALLAADARTTDPLARAPAAGIARAFDPAIDPRLGTRIGVYQVVRPLGAGGMGIVYEAVRADDQYRKRVAIKFLRHHAATDAAIRRFREERQILANLDHPHIAALLDGGVTPDGQPYFVMEYIEGEPITHWCDARARTVAQRLLLFQQVAAAVQYAHQSLVVHRDLKPGNILVTADGSVKLLDFGIARLLRDATDGDDGTLPATQAGARAFTPDYASPEQVRGQPVGTRSDVYALGVILYELLAGTRPLLLDGKTAGEVERTISEVTPGRPSAAIDAARVPLLGERTLARARARVAGDLDAITLHALRKEPDRRYGSAEEFAADLRAHLDGRPVAARPEGLGYRIGRLVRRHRLETAAITVAALSLIGGVVATTLKASEALRERARATEVRDFLATMLGAANPASFGKDVQVRTVLDSATIRADALHAQPALDADIRAIMGNTYLALGEFETAETQFRKELAAQRRLAPAGSRGTAGALVNVSTALEYLGRYADADSVLREAMTLYERYAPEDDLARADLLDIRGRILTRLGKMAEAHALLREALDIQLRSPGVSDSARAESIANLGMVSSEVGDNAGAESLLVLAVATAKRAHGEVHPLVAAILSPLATVQERAGRQERADSTFREALAMRRTLLGEEHPEYAWTMFNYADHLVYVGRYQEATVWARKVLALRGKTLTDDHPAIATGMQVLGRALGHLGEFAEAERWLRESWAVRRKTLPPGHFLLPSSESALGELLTLARRYPEAERHLLAGERGVLAARGEEAPVVQDARKRLVKLYEAWGKPDEAARWKAKLHP